MSTKPIGKPKVSREENSSDFDGDAHSEGGEGLFQHGHNNDADLFSFLSAMHLSGTSTSGPIQAAQLIASRKRKILDQGSHTGGAGGSGKLFGGMRNRTLGDDEPQLDTPQCSDAGYSEDEGRHHGSENFKTRLDGDHQPLIVDIDENLAADFDGSLSGLGVDMHSGTYSMSEALMALPSLSINAGQMFKQEVSSPPSAHRLMAKSALPAVLKEEPISNQTAKDTNSSHLDGLDLSNDDTGTFPESSTNENSVLCPQNYVGSLADESSSRQAADVLYHCQTHLSSNVTLASSDDGDMKVTHKKNSQDMSSNGYRFQYVLNASTSVATKVNEPTITYLNQGQAYELSLKRLQEPPMSKKRLYKSTIRICFHERRLQYMEAEQISEWSVKHPGERILDVDLPLSYGVLEPVRDPCVLNAITLKWDPSRETGVFLKINCISTEFTPKKHGGEKGVPFRLQVETFDADDNRLHAGGCILQVFKLKGADRKHKQDRDKILKRTPQEQDKFARPYEVTVLTDLTAEQIYVPASSRSDSPELSFVNGNATDSMRSTHSRHNSREESPALFSNGNQRDSNNGRHLSGGSVSASQIMMTATTTMPSSNLLPLTAPVEAVTQWLSRNRYGNFVANFRNYNARDMLRLSREDVISLCGLSDGIRLYNDLHMAPVAPRLTLYVALKETDKFEAIFLTDMTVAEFFHQFSIAFGLKSDVFTGLLMRSSKGILFRVSDQVLHFTETESAYLFTLRQSGDGKCEIVLESVAVPLSNATSQGQDRDQSSH